MVKQIQNMKLIIAGGRDYHLTKEDFLKLDGLPPVSEVVSGCARGVDAYGELWAKQHEIPVKRYPANWSLYGKSAGPIRNREMAEYAEALAVFPGGKGTASMRLLAKTHGLEIYDFSK